MNKIVTMRKDCLENTRLNEEYPASILQLQVLTAGQWPFTPNRENPTIPGQML